MSQIKLNLSHLLSTERERELFQRYTHRLDAIRRKWIVLLPANVGGSSVWDVNPLLWPELERLYLEEALLKQELIELLFPHHEPYRQLVEEVIQHHLNPPPPHIGVFENALSGIVLNRRQRFGMNPTYKHGFTLRADSLRGGQEVAISIECPGTDWLDLLLGKFLVPISPQRQWLSRFQLLRRSDSVLEGRFQPQGATSYTFELQKPERTIPMR